VIAVAGFSLGALALVWAFLPGALAGRLGGPFRYLKVHYFGENGADGGITQMQFINPEDEHRFVSAIENGLKAIPRTQAQPRIGNLDQAPAPAS
jgi:hypothetical protein